MPPWPAGPARKPSGSGLWKPPDAMCSLYEEFIGLAELFKCKLSYFEPA